MTARHKVSGRLFSFAGVMGPLVYEVLNPPGVDEATQTAPVENLNEFRVS